MKKEIFLIEHSPKLHKHILWETEVCMRPLSGPQASDLHTLFGLMNHDSASSRVWLYISWTDDCSLCILIDYWKVFDVLQGTNTNSKEICLSTYLSAFVKPNADRSDECI